MRGHAVTLSRCRDGARRLFHAHRRCRRRCGRSLRLHERCGRPIAGGQRSYRAACAPETQATLPPGLRVRALQRREASGPEAAGGARRRGGRGAGRDWEALGGVRPATDPEEWHGGTLAGPDVQYMALRDGALQIAGVCVYSIVMAIGRRGSGAGASPAFARAPSARAPALMRARWAMAAWAWPASCGARQQGKARQVVTSDDGCCAGTWSARRRPYPRAPPYITLARVLRPAQLCCRIITPAGVLDGVPPTA